MKTKFYCVDIEVYDTHEVKACLTERQANEKPKSHFRRVYGLSAFRFYSADKEFAETLFDGTKYGYFSTNDLIALLNTYPKYERRVA